jgi:hypothetical protein
MSSNSEEHNPKSKIPKSSLSPPRTNHAVSSEHSALNASVGVIEAAPGGATPTTATISTVAASLSPAASLPTGQMIYELEVPIFSDWDASAASAAADDRFKSFCNTLDISAGFRANPPGALSYRVCNLPSSPIMSAALLAADGFALGRLVNFGRDQEVIHSSRYAVYEVGAEKSRVAFVLFLNFAAEDEVVGRCSSRCRRIHRAFVHYVERPEQRCPCKTGCPNASHVPVSSPPNPSSIHL